MCTPVGHSLFGAFLWVAMIVPARHSLHYLWRWTRRQWDGLILAVVLANFCDLDYLPGLMLGDLNGWHHMYTHSVGWVILAGIGTCLVWKGLQPSTEDKYLALLFLAMLSHLVLDLLTEDGSAPYGIMAAWPFSLERFLSPWPVFPKASKESLGDLWQWANLRPVLVEMAVLGGLLVGMIFWKTRGSVRPAAN